MDEAADENRESTAWAALFERAAASGTELSDVRGALARRRGEGDD